MLNGIDFKKFYECHTNFTERTCVEYFISPGIKTKFDILKTHIGNKKYNRGLELGCSGNSLLVFLNNVKRKILIDLAVKPLENYIESNNSENHLFSFEKNIFNLSPLNADVCNLPFKNESFEIIVILDVLEHIKDDKKVASEITRILKKDGYVILTVPHKKNFYSYQDRIIGHYRRYDMEDLETMFHEYNLKAIKSFGIYGTLFKTAELQGFSPKRVESEIKNLRIYFQKKDWFKKLWTLVVKILAFFMKLEVKYKSLDKAMNIGYILKKVENGRK